MLLAVVWDGGDYKWVQVPGSVKKSEKLLRSKLETPVMDSLGVPIKAPPWRQIDGYARGKKTRQNGAKQNKNLVFRRLGILGDPLTPNRPAVALRPSV